ncbi:hypothetical protein GCM10027415_30440 [Humibacter ginsengisoli]
MMDSSPKNLVFLRNPQDDPLYALAMDFIDVWRINGHVPDDAELQEALRASQLWSPTSLNDLRQVINAMEPAFT